MRASTEASTDSLPTNILIKKQYSLNSTNRCQSDTYVSKHNYVFLVYKDTKYRVGCNVFGIFTTMDEAESIQKIMSKEKIEKDGDSIIISQIPLNIPISTHSDYVMKVLY